MKDDADKRLDALLDDAASDNLQYFEYIDEPRREKITATYLRSSHGAGTFDDVCINGRVALMVGGSKLEYARHSAELCSYLSNVARNAAEDYVDTILPGKYQNHKYYAKQQASIDNALGDEMREIGRVFNMFSSSGR